MKILGIYDGHNSSAAILENGKVLAAISEERITRVKNQGGFPKKAIKKVLEMTGSSLKDDINRVAVSNIHQTFDYKLSRKDTLEKYARNRPNPVQGIKDLIKKIAPVYNFHKLRFRKNRLRTINNFFKNNLSEDIKPDHFKFTDHHLTHASATYFSWGKLEEKILILTADGGGDYASASVNIGHQGAIQTLAKTQSIDSIGRLHSFITFIMGMVPLEHEYKVMGLAPYASSNSKQIQELIETFRKIYHFDSKNPLIWQRGKGVPTMHAALEFIEKIIYRKRFDHIAAALQIFTEEFLTTWVKNCIRETGIRKIALGGGVFMNVKANQKILELPEVEELFIMPSCGDETNSIGAAYLVYAQEKLKNNQPIDIQPLGPIYFGNEITNEEVEKELKNFKFESEVNIKPFQDIEKETAKLIARGKVVARAKGRMEFGARALGNRSILADPSNLKAVRVINEMIKNRDFWMPFAPSVLEERAEDYYFKPKSIKAPYMTITFNSRPEKRNKFIATCHPYDFTVRSQEVIQDWSPDYWRLLKYFEEITGEGIVLNTSFNLHGYPIVSTAKDALDVFNRSGLKYLALGNHLISKQ